MIRPAAKTLFAAAWLSAWAGPALAGPPYVTDDPQPTDLGHWEIYNYVTWARTPGNSAGEGGLDLNYGGAKDLQLTLVIPAAFQTGGGLDLGMGDIEAAAKYKVLHQKDGSPMPDVSVFPRLFLPTAPSRLGTGRVGLLLPVWAQKDFGKWSLFGGGGYQINPGPGQRNFWVSGAVLTRQFTDRFSLGAEVYHQTRDAADARDFTGVNLGMTYQLVKHWSLLAAGGPGVQNAHGQGQYQAYLALEAQY